jgi:two-component system nitrogen regulation response regulator NtrX
MVNLDYQLIGSSPVMQKLFLEIEKAAPTDGRIFIFGENGTGKELVAREIHRRSLRAKEPFIKINCAAIPKELIESELFGHEKGAFTGAIQRKIGVFETANRGTLLLDEIGDMALETQAKLLRVLQENEFVRVGGTTPISFNIRIISATNKDLKALIAAGQFREDLYFRVNVVPIFVAPLQEHREDIPVLIRHFLTDYSKKNGKPIKQITEEALIPFLEYRWPGNIRELRNMIERLVIMADRAVVSYRDVVNFLPELMLKGEGKIHTGSDLMELENPLSLKEYLDQFEKRLLEHHFIKAQKNVSRLSQNLSTDRANLHRKLKKYGIK